MLRTIGSTLLASATPGGALRKKEEARIENPALPGKGEIGSVSRGMLEEPIERQVPAGSTKVVSSTPTVEPTAAPSGVLPTQPMADQRGAPGIGLPASTPARGAANGAMPDVGIMQPTIRSQATGAAGKTVSGGALPGAQAATMYQAPEVSPMGYQGSVGQSGSPTQVMNALSGLVGSKTYAGEGGGVVRGTLGQAIAGPVGKIITAAGNALRAPQMVPGGIGAAMQTYGGSASAAKQGIGSAGAALRSAAQAAPKVLSGAAGQAAQKVSGWLRSLFGR